VCVGPFSWLGVGLGGNCDCRCGIVYAPMLGRDGFRGYIHSCVSTAVTSTYTHVLYVNLSTYIQDRW